MLWYRGDEGEPIYRYSHCDHYSDRQKIDKLKCEIKAGFILSFGILQRFFTLSRYLLIRDFTAIIKSWMVLWSDLYSLSDQIYLADHNWDIPPTRAWIPIQTRKCRIHLSPNVCDVLKFILCLMYLAKIQTLHRMTQMIFLTVWPWVSIQRQSLLKNLDFNVLEFRFVVSKFGWDLDILVLDWGTGTKLSTKDLDSWH